MATPEERQLQGNVYTDVVLSAGEHLTQFDVDILPGTQGLSPRLTEGGRLLRLPSGLWLAGFEGGDGVYLSLGRGGNAARGAGFDPPVRLAGSSGSALYQSSGTARDLQLFPGPPGALQCPRGYTGWAAWCDDEQVWLCALVVQERSVTAGALWRTGLTGVRLTAGLADRQGCVWLGVRRPAAQGSEAGVLSWDGGWRYEALCAGSESVALCADDLGRLHAAIVRVVPFAVPEALRTPGWRPRAFAESAKGRAKDREIAYQVRDPAGVWSAPELAAHGIAQRPVIAIADGRPLIVYQVEGVRQVVPRSADYLFQREGGGSGIGYAWKRPGGWQRGDVAAPDEILIQDRCEADVYKGRLYPAVEEMGPPRLVKDGHGVPWALWSNPTRRHTYFARWLDGEWSDPYELRGAYYALAPDLTAEAEPPAESRAFGVLTVAAGRLYFSTVPVPRLDPADRRSILFLDLLDLSGMSQVEVALGQFERYPGNPIFGPGSEGERDDAGVSFPQVRRFQDRWIMHYHQRRTAGASNQEGNRMGCAESADGVHWARLAIAPSQDPDVLPAGPDHSVPWVAGNFIDEAEPDANQRFKGATLYGKWTQDKERWLVTSADGRHWRVAGRAEDLYCILEAGGPSFRDEDAPSEARFAAVGRTTSTAGRALGMMRSPDLLRWSGKEALLDVDDPYGQPAMLRRGGYVAGRILDPAGERGAYQIYWGLVWKEHGLYLCLYAPYGYDGRYDVALAVSRDGQHFMRVKNGERLLPCGGGGEWDRGSIAVGYGVGQPIRLEDRLRLYYSGSTGHHGTKPWGSTSCVGFADLPIDGYSCVRVRRGAPGSVGTVTTLPFAVPRGFSPAVGVRLGPQSFYAGASHPDDSPAHGRVSAEFLDAASNEPIPGFEARSSHAAAGPGAHRIEWPGADPAALAGRSVRLRLVLTGMDVWLYSFWFEGGSPDD